MNIIAYIRLGIDCLQEELLQTLNNMRTKLDKDATNYQQKIFQLTEQVEHLERQLLNAGQQQGMRGSQSESSLSPSSPNEFDRFHPIVSFQHSSCTRWTPASTTPLRLLVDLSHQAFHLLHPLLRDVECPAY